jgi:NAD-dependent SIR2 family protein deacetylase
LPVSSARRRSPTDRVDCDPPQCLQEARISTLSELPRPSVDSIDAFVKLLKRAKKVVVIAGAGISVSCGIPDFRSKDGIYNMARHMDVVLPEPECLFQIEYFRQDPTPFFQIVRNAFANSPVPSATHRFLKLLQDKKKLLRVYTQNIDGLEEAAGVTEVIPCHGSFAWSTCMRCRHRVPTSELMDAIQAGVIPTCSLGDCRGVLKPDITFFGEVLDDRVSTSITRDRLQADLLLVMGTSLKVAPVMEIPGYLPAHIPQVVINMTALKKKKIKKKATAMSNTMTQGGSKDDKDNKDGEEFDLSLLGDCDEIVQYICNRARWDLNAATADSDEDVQIVKVRSSSGSGSQRSKTDKTKTKKNKKVKKPKIISHEERKRRKKVFCFGECHCDKRLATAADDASLESDSEEPERVVWYVAWSERLCALQGGADLVSCSPHW